MELHDLKLVVLAVLLVSCYLQTGEALQCYFCTVNSDSPDTKCNSTVVNCTDDETFCNIYTSKGRDNIYAFTRACVTAEVCHANYCEETVKGILGKTNCSISCCQEDLCNHNHSTILQYNATPVPNVSQSSTKSVSNLVHFFILAKFAEFFYLI